MPNVRKERCSGKNIVVMKQPFKREEEKEDPLAKQNEMDWSHMVEKGVLFHVTTHYIYLYIRINVTSQVTSSGEKVKCLQHKGKALDFKMAK